MDIFFNEVRLILVFSKSFALFNELIEWIVFRTPIEKLNVIVFLSESDVVLLFAKRIQFGCLNFLNRLVELWHDVNL